MLVRNVTINGQSFSGATARANGVLLDDFKKDVGLQTFSLDRKTSTGAIVGRTVAQGRLFSISGKVFAVEDAARQAAIDFVNAACVPDDLISASPLLDVEWDDMAWRSYKTRAQVYKMPEWSHEVAQPIASFRFELLSPDATYKGADDNVSTASVSVTGGMTMPALYPTLLGGESWAFTVTNNGDFPAPVRIEIIGIVQDPKIRNVLNGRFYQLSWVTTSQLVIDGTVSPFTVTDGSVDVSGYRVAGSTTPMLSTGTNTLAVTGTFTWVPVVTVYWNDTYVS